MVRSGALLVVGALCAAVVAGAAPASAGGPVVDRTIRDSRITESSGLAVSPQHPGVLWTHGDSGNPPVLYALRPDGAVAAAVRVRGVADVDWEAMAAFQDSAGQAVLAVADIGDNQARRSSVEIVLVREPRTLRDVTVTPTRVLRLTYPDGPRDAETLLVDAAAGRMYIVSKGLGGTVYQVPTQVWPGPPGGAPRSSGTLQRIATVPLILVTDGVMGPGHHPVLRTYGELAVLPPITPAAVGGSLRPLAEMALPSQRQGEGLALTADGQVLLSSEGTREPVLRLPLAPDLAAVLADGSRAGASDPARASGSASGSSGSAADAPRGGPAAGGPDGDDDRYPVLLLFGAALVAAAVGVVVGVRRR